MRDTRDQWKKLLHLCLMTSKSKAMGMLLTETKSREVSKTFRTSQIHTFLSYADNNISLPVTEREENQSMREHCLKNATGPIRKLCNPHLYKKYKNSCWNKFYFVHILYNGHLKYINYTQMCPHYPVPTMSSKYWSLFQDLLGFQKYTTNSDFHS